MNFATDKDKIANDIANKGGLKNKCERCDSEHFSLLDGFFRLDAQQDLNETVIGGPSVPAFGMVCTDCGSISFFAVKNIYPDAY